VRCSSFDIGKLRCHFAVADGENVDSSNVPRLSVALLAIDVGALFCESWIEVIGMGVSVAALVILGRIAARTAVFPMF